MNGDGDERDEGGQHDNINRNSVGAALSAAGG